MKRTDQDSGHEDSLCNDVSSWQGFKASRKVTHKKFVLTTLNSVFGFEESKPNKKSPEDIQDELGHEISRISPIREE